MYLPKELDKALTVLSLWMGWRRCSQGCHCVHFVYFLRFEHKPSQTKCVERLDVMSPSLATDILDAVVFRILSHFFGICMCCESDM